MNKKIILGISLFLISWGLMVILLYSINLFLIISSIILLILVNYGLLFEKKISKKSYRLKNHLFNLLVICVLIMAILSSNTLSRIEKASIINLNNSQRNLEHFYYEDTMLSDQLSNGGSSSDYDYINFHYVALGIYGFQTDMDYSSAINNICNISITFDSSFFKYNDQIIRSDFTIRIIYLNNEIKDTIGSNSELEGYGIWENVGSYWNEKGDPDITKDSEGDYQFYSEFSFTSNDCLDGKTVNMTDVWQGSYMLLIESVITLPIDENDEPNSHIYENPNNLAFVATLNLQIITDVAGSNSQGYMWQFVDLEYVRGAGDFFADIIGKRNLVMLGVFFTIYFIGLIISLIKGNNFIILFIMSILGVLITISAISEFANLVINNPPPKWSRKLFGEDNASWIWTVFAIVRTLVVYYFFYQILQSLTSFSLSIQEKLNQLMEVAG